MSLFILFKTTVGLAVVLHGGAFAQPGPFGRRLGRGEHLRE